MTEYFGDGNPRECEFEVMVKDGDLCRLLPLRLDLRNHSPTGFAWGYLGSGPAQLSLALLADALDDDKLALKHYQRFKDEVVSRFPSTWKITSAQIKDWLAEKAAAQNGP